MKVISALGEEKQRLQAQQGAEHAVQSNAADKGCIILLSNAENAK